MNSYSHLKIKVSKEFHKEIKLGYSLQKFPKFYNKIYFFTKFLSSFEIIRKIARKIFECDQYKNIVSRVTSIVSH